MSIAQSMTSTVDTRPPWRLIDILIVVVAYLTLYILLSGIAAALGLLQTAQSRLNSSLIITIITDLAIVALIIGLVRNRGGHPEMLGFRPLPSGLLYLPAIGFLGAFAVLFIYTGIVEALGLPNLAPQNNAPPGAFDTPVSTFLFGTVAIVVAPFAEEVIFRGFLLGGLLRWFPAWAAVLLSGILFGAVHAQPGAVAIVIPIALIGILLGVIYRVATSLFASIGTHFLFNTVAFLAMFVAEAR